MPRSRISRAEAAVIARLWLCVTSFDARGTLSPDDT